MKNDKVRFGMEIDKDLKEELREYGEHPDVDRTMTWLAEHFIKEGLARANGDGQ